MRDEVCFIFFFLCVLTVILLYVVHEYMINNKNNLSFRGGEKAEFAEHVSNSPTIAIRMRVETGWAGKRDRSISGVTRYRRLYWKKSRAQQNASRDSIPTTISPGA